MNVEVRVYKRYDTDILALHDSGYSITKMMTDAVTAYANGRPCHFFIDEILPFDMNDKKNVRLRLKINNNDYNTIRMLKDIKHGYRSNFCKQVLRNAMIQQNLACYFSSLSSLPLQEMNAKNLNIQAYPNLIMCNQYRRLTQKLNIMGNDITITHEKGYAYNSAKNIEIQQPNNTMAHLHHTKRIPQESRRSQSSLQQQAQNPSLPSYGNGSSSMPGYPNTPYGQNISPQMQTVQSMPNQQMSYMDSVAYQNINQDNAYTNYQNYSNMQSQKMQEQMPNMDIPQQNPPMLQYGNKASSMPGYSNAPYEQNADLQMQHPTQEANQQPQKSQMEQYIEPPVRSSVSQYNEPESIVPKNDTQVITEQKTEAEAVKDEDFDDSDSLMAIFDNL